MIQQKHIAQIIRLGGVEKLSDDEIREIYDYTKDGQAIGELALLLEIEAQRQMKIRFSRRQARVVCGSVWHENRIKYAYDRKKAAGQCVDTKKPVPSRNPFDLKPTRQSVLRGSNYRISKSMIRFGEHYITAHEDADGSNRTVRAYTLNKNGGYVFFKSVDVDNLKGHWQIRALVGLFDIEPVRVEKDLKPVQQHKYFGVEHLRTIGGITLYRRTLAGNPVDYCLVRHYTPYHGTTIRDCFKQMRNEFLYVSALAL